MCHIYTDPSFWFDFDSEVQSVPKKTTRFYKKWFWTVSIFLDCLDETISSEFWNLEEFVEEF